MNAGALGPARREVGAWARVRMPDGEHILTPATLGYAYRTSVLQQRPAVVAEATLQLQRSASEIVRRRTEEWLAHRAATQPIGPPSSGCIFRNPAGDHAGRLIDLAGGQGLQVGGAQGSEVHANYLVKNRAASATH